MSYRCYDQIFFELKKILFPRLTEHIKKQFEQIEKINVKKLQINRRL